MVERVVSLCVLASLFIMFGRVEVKEPTIEEVNAKQFAQVIEENDYVAVYWCKSRGRCRIF